MLKVLAHFSDLADPRAANSRHELSEIMFIAIAATLAGTWNDDALVKMLSQMR